MDLFVSEVDAFERQVDRLLEASNNLSANQIVSELPRIQDAVAKLQRGIETLDASLPVVDASADPAIGMGLPDGVRESPNEVFYRDLNSKK